jgi:hypothetical protein
MAVAPSARLKYLTYRTESPRRSVRINPGKGKEM